MPDTTEAVVEGAVEPTKRLVRILFFFFLTGAFGFSPVRRGWTEGELERTLQGRYGHLVAELQRTQKLMEDLLASLVRRGWTEGELREEREFGF
uniref:Uncharacterized protein n=1 Tax=Fagus sylvatica TaxID=28930 RepID=A0A2N9FJC9_FAGSY